MAQYKVPQDVEAEDKLLGPFTFRQFIYLLIAAAGIAGAWGLFQLFPLLALIPLPFVFFFGVLALPLKKDQPMETYLAAIISFYFKPNRRIWTAGQRESTIKIIAPKKAEKSRTRNLTEEEASHRLSFLASIIDTEGYAIRGDSSMKDEYAAEADTIEDVLDADNPVIDRIIEQEQTERKQELIAQMRTAINRTDNLTATPSANTPIAAPSPILPAPSLPQPQATPTTINQQLQNLATNNSFSIQTIAQQANRIQQTLQPQPTLQPQQTLQPQPTFQPQQTFQPQPFSQSSTPLQPSYPSPQPQSAQPQSSQPAINPPDLYGPPPAIFSTNQQN